MDSILFFVTLRVFVGAIVAMVVGPIIVLIYARGKFDYRSSNSSQALKTS